MNSTSTSINNLGAAFPPATNLNPNPNLRVLEETAAQPPLPGDGAQEETLRAPVCSLFGQYLDDQVERASLGLAHELVDRGWSEAWIAGAGIVVLFLCFALETGLASLLNLGFWYLVCSLLAWSQVGRIGVRAIGYYYHFFSEAQAAQEEQTENEQA